MSPSKKLVPHTKFCVEGVAASALCGILFGPLRGYLVVSFSATSRDGVSTTLIPSASFLLLLLSIDVHDSCS